MRHVPLDATQLSVVHAFIKSDVDQMLMIGAGGYGKSEVVYKSNKRAAAGVGLYPGSLARYFTSHYR